jgi:hypothetical protein
MAIVIMVAMGLLIQMQDMCGIEHTALSEEQATMRDAKLVELNRRLKVVLDFEPALVGKDVQNKIKDGHGTIDQLDDVVWRLEKAVDSLIYARSKNLGTAGLINKKVDELERRMIKLFTLDNQERKDNRTLRKRDSLELTLHHGSQPMIKLKKIKAMLIAAPTLADIPLDDIVADLINIDELLRGYEAMYSDASIRARKEKVE